MLQGRDLILGAAVGQTGIPGDWLNGVIKWPRSIAWLERLGERLATSRTPGTSVRPLPLFMPAVPIRNAFFLLVVLAHGFRRLGPPY